MSSERLAEALLADAYQLIAGGWCTGTSAQDAAGRPVEPSSPAARRWSPGGALVRLRDQSMVEGDAALEAYCLASLALSAAVKAVPDAWNDVPGRRHEEILEAFARAVSLVRSPVATWLDAPEFGAQLQPSDSDTSPDGLKRLAGAVEAA